MSESTTDDGPQAWRRLHAVLVADTSGVGRPAGDAAAPARIRDVCTAVVGRHGGTLDVHAGDCVVALFDGAVDAVQAAIAIQTDLATLSRAAGDAPRIRIGIHLGDVVRSGPELLGDGVHVAARLQALAAPGAIAVSDEVRRAARHRISLPFHDLGTKALADVPSRIRVYELRLDDAAAGGEERPAQSLRRIGRVAVAVVLVAGLAALGHRLATRPAMLGVAPVAAPIAPPAVAPPAVPAGGAPAPSAEQPLTVGVTGVSAQGDVPGWMRDNTRDGLNTLLSKVGRLRVFSREKIDFLRERRGLSEIEVAETLGIQKMIVGSLAMDGRNVVLEARVVDIASGILEASESARGEPDDLIELQNRLATGLLSALSIPLSDADRAQMLANRSKESLDGYRRLADTFGAPPDEPAAPRPARRRTSWLAWPRSAWADEATAAAEQRIRSLLDAYRAALQAEDIAAVAATHVGLSDEQRAGFVRYFEGANGLDVTLSDVDVLVDGDQALVTFTRHDTFRDAQSGKEMRLEVRLSSVVEQRDGGWLLRGVKRSS